MSQTRWQGQRFFFTYSRCNLEFDDVLDAIKSKKPFRRAIIVREPHADGEPHIHVVVEFERRIDFRDPHFFDIGTAHPNFGPVRTWGACVNYCRKGPSCPIRYEGCTPEDATESSTGSREESDHYARCESSSGERDWFSYALRESIPYAYADRFWRMCHGPRAPTLYERDTAGTIRLDLAAHVLGGEYTTVVCGPSGCGKTTWAKREAPLPALYVTDTDDLATFDPKVHRSIIFDEIRATGDANGKGRWPLTSQIKAVTHHDAASIRIRYTLARIPAFTVKIFLCTDSFLFDNDIQIMRRIKLINLYSEEHNIFV